MRRRTKKSPTKRILTCPQCGSDRLIYDAGLITGQVYHCLKCDYVGSFVVELEVDPADGTPIS